MSTLQRRYESIVLLRAHLGFRVLAARRVGDAEPRVLVTPSRLAEPALAMQALERALHAHAQIEHPSVPRALGIYEVEGHPVLELDCPAVADGVEFARRISASGVRLPYQAADAFIVGIRLGLQAAHAATDPDTGGPICAGRLSWANVLFAEDGRWFVFGFGHNVALENEHHVPDPTIPHFAAPEVLLGHPATPEGDYVALLQMMRAGIHMVDRRDALGRILAGLTGHSDAALVELVRWFDRRMFGEPPASRPTIAEAVAQSDRVRAVLGVKLDPHGMAEVAARVLALSTGVTGATLSLTPEGETARWNDEPAVKLRGPMRRVLIGLVQRQQMGFPSPLRPSELVEIGWPDEATSHESALNRVYVTLNRLRKLFPAGVIERFDDGYRLRADVNVRRALIA